MPRTAILYVAERCNQECVFCLEEDGNWKEFIDPSTVEVFELLGRLRERGAEQLTFMGGETFFRKDLGRILTEAKRRGYTRVGVTTNGTVLSRKGFVRQLVDAGLDFIEFSLHGHTPELANLIGGTHFTFERQAEALAELDELGSLPTILNVVVCRENRDQLLSIARHVCERYPRIPVRFKFKFVSLQGLAATTALLGHAGLGYEEVDAVAVGDYLAGRGLPFWFYNLPLCRLGAHAGHAHELGSLAADERYFDYDHTGGTGYYDSGYQLQNHVWPERACGSCSVRAICPGIEARHRVAHGSGALAPRGDEPLPLLEQALRDRGLDPALAPARLSAALREPRPASALRAAAEEGALRFAHEREPAGVELLIEERVEGQEAFTTTERFALSYRPSTQDEARQRPHLLLLLAAAAEAMRRADGAGLALAAVRRAVVAAAPAGFTLETAVAEKAGARAAGEPRRKGALPVLSGGEVR